LANDCLGGHNCVCLTAQVDDVLVGQAATRFVLGIGCPQHRKQFIIERVLMGVGKYDAVFHFSGFADGFRVC
jgi:hypothetical protein